MGDISCVRVHFVRNFADAVVIGQRRGDNKLTHRLTVNEKDKVPADTRDSDFTRSCTVLTVIANTFPNPQRNAAEVALRDVG